MRETQRVRPKNARASATNKNTSQMYHCDMPSMALMPVRTQNSAVPEKHAGCTLNSYDVRHDSTSPLPRHASTPHHQLTSPHTPHQHTLLHILPLCSATTLMSKWVSL